MLEAGSGSAVGVGSAAGPQQTRQPQGDWISNALWLGLVLVIGLLLALVVYAAYEGIFRPQPPRTAEERQLQVLTKAIADNPKSVAAWTDYADTLIGLGHLKAAGDAIAQGLKVAPDSASLVLEKARLEASQGKTAEALKVADRVLKIVADAQAKQAQENLAKGVTYVPQGGDVVVQALLLKAGVYVGEKQWPQVVDAASAALKEDGTMADVLIVRAKAYLEEGKKEPARKDAEQALKYAPGYAPAAELLKNLGK